MTQYLHGSVQAPLEQTHTKVLEMPGLAMLVIASLTPGQRGGTATRHAPAKHTASHLPSSPLLTEVKTQATLQQAAEAHLKIFSEMHTQQIGTRRKGKEEVGEAGSGGILPNPVSRPRSETLGVCAFAQPSH